jgi:hypothetical protein
MTLPRKGRRSITVDDVDYHYKIAFERSERAVIQNADGTGAFLFVFPFAIMKPANVADAIRFAISCEWTPERNGDACWLAFDADTDGRSHFEHIPNDDFRVVTYSSHGRIPDNMDTSQFDDTRPWYHRTRPTTHAK